jgi:hypothetical protein
VAAGTVTSFVSWAIVSGRPGVGSQLGVVCVALGGLVVSFLGEALWLLHGRRAVGERTLYLLGKPPDRRPLQGAAIQAYTGAVVGGDGLGWYHRTDCPLAAGQAFPAANRSQHEAAGRHPCRICRP